MTIDYIRKTGLLAGRNVGHKHSCFRLDAWEAFIQTKIDLDMQDLSNSDFLISILDFVKEHFGMGEQLESMKADVAEAIKRKEPQDIERMTPEEAEKYYEETMGEEEEDI
jgi:hypothetical protein